MIPHHFEAVEIRRHAGAFFADVVQQAASQDDYEAVSVDWLSPQECMQKFNEDAVSLPPPQVRCAALVNSTRAPLARPYMAVHSFLYPSTCLV